MTKLMDKAIHEIQKLPESDQDSFAQWILDEIKSERKWQKLFESSKDKLIKMAKMAEEEESEHLDIEKPNEKKETPMRVHYDEEIDALYIYLDDKTPDGVVEVDEGINIDSTEDGKLTGIEILDASKKIDLKTILTYSLELDTDILHKKLA